MRGKWMRSTLRRENLSVRFVGAERVEMLVSFWSQRNLVIPVMYWKMEKQIRRQLITFGNRSAFSITTVGSTRCPGLSVEVPQPLHIKLRSPSIWWVPLVSFCFNLSLHCLVDQQNVFIFLLLALLKMGDYYRDLSSRTGEDSLSLLGQAILMYSRAAAAGSPQVTDLLQL